MINKKALKKFITYFSISLLLGIVIFFLYTFFPKSLDSIDNRIRDFFFLVRGEIPNTNNVIIIDIDEKSLQELGQWPWSRNKVAKILKNLTNAGIGIIGLDIVFAEEDNSSPHKVLKQLNMKKENVPNYDEILARTIANTPTILGYQFELNKNDYVNKNAPDIPAIFIQRHKPKNQNFLIQAKGTILNIPIIQNNSYSSGFFNNIPDISGTVRSVPLIISYEGNIYSSLSLEILRVITNSKKVLINYDENGINNIVLNQIKIPTDRNGKIMVNYRGAKKNFKYFSAIDIYNNKIDKKELEGKIALIGTSATGILDLRATPFEEVFPGVEVHANVIDNIISEDFISKNSSVDGANIVLIFALSITIVLLITYSSFWLSPLIFFSFLAGIFIFLYKMLFSYGIILNIFFPLLTIISASALAILIDYFYEIKKEEKIKKKFASKVSKKVMENLLKNIDNNEFQAMEKEVTVFFSDIRGFTKISEKMANAKTLIEYLNQYMEPMSDIITRYEGTIDKFIGDAIMAYWNAPTDVENHADKALQAALKQLEEIEILNEKLKQENKPLIEIGIGLNTGLSVVGEMGSKGRSDYTVIGDSINLGSRIESLCKYYDSNLNITNFTKEALKEEYVFKFLDYVIVKGKEEPVEIWQVLKKGKATKEEKEYLNTYHEALELYKVSKFEEALVLLEKLKKENSTKILDIYIKRCKEFILTPPKNFDGIYQHITKN